MNVNLAKRVFNHILAHPEEFDQGNWHCGTKHCFAGHTQVLVGKPASDMTVRRDAIEALDIPQIDAEWLFAGSRHLSEIREYIAAEGGYFDRDGFNRAGWDRDGFNRAGWDRDGFNRDGFNRAGFNRDGGRLEPFVIEDELVSV